MSDELMLEQEEAPAKERVARVCSYALQVCTLAEGCPTVVPWLRTWDAKEIQREALDCEHAGLTLRAEEAAGAFVLRRPRDEITRKSLRTRRIKAIRGEG